MNFNDLGLSAPILKAVAEQGYEHASPIQEKAIPAVLAGKDVMAAAQTGTGKTAGFTLPILALLEQGELASANNVRTLILTPTRELAAQVAASVETYGKYLNLRSTVVFGGVKINPQMMKLRRGTDILVATPGRLLDLYQQNAVKFSELKVLVLDEADRMLDMGFINDIKKILRVLPKNRQNLMFSATFSPDIRELAKGLMDNPVEISVSQPNSTATGVNQWMCPVDKAQKPEVLIELITQHKWRQVLVFTRTKHGANKLARQLDDAGIKSAAIHGNKSQGARTRALEEFKSHKVRVLVATDIAARGLDIDQLPEVVNFDLPHVAEDYVHRIGRTGRAGATGQAVSLVSADEHKQLVDIERLIKKCLPRKTLDGYEPNHDVPGSNVRPKPSPAAPRNNNSRNSSQGRRSSSDRAGAPTNGTTRPRSANSRGDRGAAPAGVRAPRPAGSGGRRAPSSSTSGSRSR